MKDTQAEELQIPLSEMLETLRSELQTSLQRGQGKLVSFDVDKIDLELKVTVARKLKGDAGIAFWVVKAGAEVERSGDSVHTFRLTLTPVDSAKGSRLRVADEQREKPDTR